jgi:hypothetical protein
MAAVAAGNRHSGELGGLVAVAARIIPVAKTAIVT